MVIEPVRHTSVWWTYFRMEEVADINLIESFVWLIAGASLIETAPCRFKV